MTDDRRPYAVPTESLPALEVSYHLQDIVEVRTFLEGRGVGTSNTRIERYAQYLERTLRDGFEWIAGEEVFKNSADARFRSPLDWFLYVLREVHELMWILKGLRIHVPVGADEKLKFIAGGSDFAALDEDSRSRDAQFELRIASYFCQGGCEIDMSTDTDIIARMNRYVFFVECKRVGTRSKIRRRLSEARRQLRRRMPRKGWCRRPVGLIAVDVTKVAFKHNGLTFGVTNEHARDVIRDKLQEVGGEAHHLMSFESCPRLLGYWLQIHIPALAAMQPFPEVVLTTRFSSLQVARASMGGKDRKILKAFYDMFESVSRYDVRSLPGRALTPRETVTIPAGSTFGVEGDRVMQLLEKEAVSEDEQAEVVGTMVVNGIEYKFTFFEVCLLPSELIEEWKREIAQDRGMGSLMLVASLYKQRFPYEESEPMTQRDAPSVATPEPSEDEE